MSAYAELAGKLQFPDSQRLISILEHLMTPELAEIANFLPGTADDVADKMGMNPDTAKASLEYMFFRGLVLARGNLAERNSYRAHRSIIQIHDATLICLKPEKNEELYHMWHEFFHEEFFPYLAKESFISGRIVPAYNAIKDLPGVQPWENFREILKAQEKIAVVPCLCRLENKTAGQACRHTDEEAFWKCLQFGKGADYVIVRGVGKQLTQEEVMAMADRVEEDGLVHIWGTDRKMQGQISCQCCDDCCLNFLTAKENNVSIEKTYLKSRYGASIDLEQCSGCQECVERCNFDAIEMVLEGKKYKASVDEEKCWGCGVCVLKCSTGALKMKTVRPVDYVPETVQ
ncbi:MAG: ATP-binding protein [Bacillota bacterium]